MNAHVNTPFEIKDGDIVRRVFTGPVIKSINQELRQIEFVISTAAVDRYGDIVTVNGWDLKAYRQNPVVLFGHNSSIPPIGKAIKTWKEGDALRSIAQFMPADLSAFADSIYRMYLEGYLRAVSVGFRPTKYEPIMDDNGDYTYAYKFLKQELLEFSAVPVPANPEALVAARAKGIDTLPFKSWAEEILDNWKTTEKDVGDLYGMNKKEVETLRRRAAGAGASIVVPLHVQDALLARNLAAVRRSKEEKENAVSFETIEVGGEEHELPTRKLKDGEVLGDMEFTKHTDLIDEKEVHTIDLTKADDLVMVDPVIIEEAGEVCAVKTVEYEGGSMLCLEIKTGAREVTYELIGVDAQGKLFASKVKDSVTDTKEIDEPVSGDAPDTKTTPEAEEKDTAADGENKDVDDAADKKDKTVVVNVFDAADPKALDEWLSTKKGEQALINIMKKNGYSKSVEGSEEELDITLDFSTNLSYIEKVLCDFEESFETEKQLTKHEQRKATLIAQQMREIADRLIGPVKDEKEAAPLVPVSNTTNTKESTNSVNVQKYLENVIGALQPKLAEMIEQKLAKMRGRLD